MRSDTPLETIYRYWRSTRQVGHTTFGLNGVHYMKPSILVVADSRQARHLMQDAKVAGFTVTPALGRIGETILLPIGEVQNKLHGYRLPLSIEHYALDQLIVQHTAAINKHWREELSSVAGELIVKEPEPKWGKNRRGGFTEGLSYAVSKLGKLYKADR